MEFALKPLLIWGEQKFFNQVTIGFHRNILVVAFVTEHMCERIFANSKTKYAMIGIQIEIKASQPVIIIDTQRNTKLLALVIFI